MACCHLFRRKKDEYETKYFMQKKLVLVGDGACGKTSLLYRYTRGEFYDSAYIPTMFETEAVDVEYNGKMVSLILYDTAGQEAYAHLRPLSYPMSDIVLICFDLSDKDTLQNVEEMWAPEIRECCRDVPIVLVGNKKDIREDSRLYTNTTGMPVDYETGLAVANKIGAEAYVECSAKTNEGVANVFNQSIKTYCDYKKFARKMRRSFRSSKYLEINA